MFELMDRQQGSMVASPRPRQSLRRWGNSLGVRLPAAISREAGLQDNQTVELTVVAEGALIRPVEPRLHPIGCLDADKPSQVRSIVGQILGFLP
jgi:antitoxin MazE